jgi:multidrug transporter EmrE-like cation transporter
LPPLHRLISAIIILGVELAILLLVCGTLYALALLGLRVMPVPTAYPEWRGFATLKACNLLVAFFVAISTSLVVLAGRSST